jgi:hypothetical protein
MNPENGGKTFCVKCGDKEVKNLVQQTTDRRQGYSLHAYLFNIFINVIKCIQTTNSMV